MPQTNSLPLSRWAFVRYIKISAGVHCFLTSHSQKKNTNLSGHRRECSWKEEKGKK